MRIGALVVCSLAIGCSSAQTVLTVVAPNPPAIGGAGKPGAKVTARLVRVDPFGQPVSATCLASAHTATTVGLDGAWSCDRWAVLVDNANYVFPGRFPPGNYALTVAVSEGQATAAVQVAGGR